MKFWRDHISKNTGLRSIIFAPIKSYLNVIMPHEVSFEIFLNKIEEFLFPKIQSINSFYGYSDIILPIIPIIDDRKRTSVFQQNCSSKKLVILTLKLRMLRFECKYITYLGANEYRDTLQMYLQ